MLCLCGLFNGGSLFAEEVTHPLGHSKAEDTTPHQNAERDRLSAAMLAIEDPEIKERVENFLFKVELIAMRGWRHVDKAEVYYFTFLRLIHAARTFDPSLHVDFSTYCDSHLKWGPFDAYRRSRGRQTIQLTRELYASVKSVEGSIDQFYKEQGRPPSESELTTTLGMAYEELQTIQRWRRAVNVLSLNHQDEINHLPQRENQLRDYVLQDLVDVLLERLSSSDLREVIIEHYLKGRRVEEIAEEKQVDPFHIWYLRKKALRECRASLGRFGLTPEDFN